MKRKTLRYDVVVVGGGAAGAAAAVASARLGAKTLLIERYGFLGGAATNSLVLTYCGFYMAGAAQRRAVGGVGWELLLQLQRLGFDTSPVRSKSGNWLVMIDVEAVKFAFDTLVSVPNLDLRFHTRLISSTVSADKIQSIQIADHAGIHDIEAPSFVDASGEASLCAFSGATFSQAGGPNATVQPASLPVHLGGVPPDVKVDGEELRALVTRFNAQSPVPLFRQDGGVFARLPLCNDFWWMGIDLPTIGLQGDELAAVEMTARRQAWSFLPFLRELPGFENAFIVATGPQIGIRETRRPWSLGDITGDDGSVGRRREDGLGQGCWPMEVHEAPGRAIFVPIGGDGYFDIPHSALQSKDIANLRLAGRVAGADAQAYGSTRVMGTAFVTGQAAGVSAALQADSGNTPEATTVRGALITQHAIV